MLLSGFPCRLGFLLIIFSINPCTLSLTTYGLYFSFKISVSFFSMCCILPYCYPTVRLISSVYFGILVPCRNFTVFKLSNITTICIRMKYFIEVSIHKWLLIFIYRRFTEFFLTNIVTTSVIEIVIYIKNWCGCLVIRVNICNIY